MYSSLHPKEKAFALVWNGNNKDFTGHRKKGQNKVANSEV